MVGIPSTELYRFPLKLLLTFNYVKKNATRWFVGRAERLPVNNELTAKMVMSCYGNVIW